MRGPNKEEAPQSSMIEVRGRNASMNLADHWHPQIARGSGFQYFWWGLVMQDPAFVAKSGLDAGGFYADADKGNWKSFMFRKRDQNVRLTWPHLNFMLRQIDDVNLNATRFSTMFGKSFEYYGGSAKPSTTNAALGVVYEILPGHALPQKHPPAYPGMPNGRR